MRPCLYKGLACTCIEVQLSSKDVADSTACSSEIKLGGVKMADADQQQSNTEYQLKEPHHYKIVSSLMGAEYELDAINTALIAVDKYKQLKDIAYYIKHEYDRKYPGSGKATEGVYHVVVGKSFASAVSHETRQFIHLKVDTLHIVLWKSKDTPFHVTE